MTKLGAKKSFDNDKFCSSGTKKQKLKRIQCSRKKYIKFFITFINKNVLQSFEKVISHIVFLIYILKIHKLSEIRGNSGRRKEEKNQDFFQIKLVDLQLTIPFLEMCIFFEHFIDCHLMSNCERQTSLGTSINQVEFTPGR